MPKVTIWFTDGTFQSLNCHVSMSPDDHTVSLMDDECVNLSDPIPYDTIINIHVSMVPPQPRRRTRA